MSYLIRVMTAEDYPAVCSLDKLEYEGKSYYITEDTFDRLACRKNFGGFMLSWDNIHIGHVCFYDDDHGNRVIATLTVHPIYRRQLAGTILMRAAFESFSGTHTRHGGVYVHIRVSNVAAKNWLTKIGFNVTDHIINRAYSLPENPIEEDGILAHIGDMIWMLPDEKPEIVGEPHVVARREF